METLDKLDIASLREQRLDARLTNTELALRVSLSAAPRWRRMRALEESGFITGYRAEINRLKTGLGVPAFVRLDADHNRGNATREPEEAIKKLPEIIACHYINGTGTFELQVVAQDLEASSRSALQSRINPLNVKDLHTSSSLGEVKAGSALPLGRLTRKAP